MADVDNFTDAELRTKLNEFGFPLMPITGTTRKVMTKKLKLLMENQVKTSSSDRRSLGKFSSDEESDAEVKLSKKDKNRRVTMAVTPMQQPKVKLVRESPAPVVKEVAAVSNEMEPPLAPAPVVKEKRKSTARSAKIILQVQESPDTNSDSEPEIVETDYKQSYKIEVPLKAPATTSKKSSPSPPPALTRPPSETISARPTTTSPSRYSVYSKPVSYDASEELDKIRKRLSLSSRYEPPKTSVSDDNLDESTPFLSNFTRQLSQMSQSQDAISSAMSSPGRSDVIKEHDTNGSMLYNRSSYLTRPKSRDYARTSYGNTSEAPPSKGTNVSVILIAAAGLFFVVLAALYYGLHSGSNSSEIIGLSVPYCHTTRGKHCLTEKEATGAIEIYKIIKPLLITHAISSQCEGNAKFYMTDEDVVSHIKLHYKALHELEIIQDVDNFIILLFKNSFLGVSVLQAQDGVFTAATSATKALDDYFVQAQQNYKRALAVLSPSLPWKCSLLIKFTGFVRGLLIVLTIATAIWLLKYGYKWYKYYEQRRKEEIVLMVERILDVVQSNAADDNFVVINHVRDMIIPINHRKKMETTWRKALVFINENESRLRTEVQVVKGEQYEVWRWLGGMNLNVSGKSNKSWQGQAFETQAGSPNSPPCSPTGCLKIRGMVDEGDRNLHTIREAVLVKCAEQCRILHCSVDLNSKCVYLKCAEPSDAAVAYQNLHGWWYASHLVTVKYLRDERYMQRFPDSPKSGPPFLKAHANN